jgi:hypothetical protein
MTVDLLNKFENLEKNFIVGFQSMPVLVTNSSILLDAPVTIGKIKLNTANLKSCLSNKKGQELVVDEYSKSIIRTLIRESTEAITSYSTDSNQYIRIKFNDTFNFARIMRNSFSHNYIFSFSTFYKNILRTRNIEWNGNVIQLSMEGTPLEKTFFGYEDALNLFYDLREMIKDELS